MQKSVITTHILDTQRGRPAVGVEVTLYRAAGADISAPDWQHMATACTNDDQVWRRFCTLPQPNALGG